MKLVIQDDEGHKTVVPFVKEEISVGRQAGNTIRLTERNVSRHHARLFRENGAIVVEDLGSSNGTLVNGQPVQGRFVLQPGDHIRIGDYFVFIQADQIVYTPSVPQVSNGAEDHAHLPNPLEMGLEGPTEAIPSAPTATADPTQEETVQVSALEGVPPPPRSGLRAALLAVCLLGLGVALYLFIVTTPVTSIPDEASTQPPSQVVKERQEPVVSEPKLAQPEAPAQQQIEPVEAKPPPEPIAISSPSPLLPNKPNGISGAHDRRTRQNAPVSNSPESPRRLPEETETKLAALSSARPSKPVEPAQLYEQAAVQFRKNQLSEAATTLKECVRLEPSFAKCHQMLGATYARLAEPQLGAEHYRKFIQLAPDDPEAAKVRIFLEQYESTKGISKKD